ncbi:MAG: hypothetical protein PF541_18030 [Prolixibacteraceae bacterium]|jgi:hypothetical protein|nr:hypothetical protein [Prolixibacteraceae bacterium]
MKQVILTIVILIACSISSNARSIVKESETFTIHTNEIAELNLDMNKSWTITYGEANKNIVVYKINTKKGEEYIVRNNFFEVLYCNTKKGFGVKQIRNRQCEVDPILTGYVINNNEMLKQAQMSPKKLSEEKALSYIAGFVPHLLNENYKHLLK